MTSPSLGDDYVVERTRRSLQDPGQLRSAPLGSQAIQLRLLSTSRFTEFYLSRCNAGLILGSQLLFVRVLSQEDITIYLRQVLVRV
jgi:hypothetical protein